MKYEEVTERTPQEVWALIAEGEVERISEAIIGVALHGTHMDEAVAICLTLADHAVPEVHGNAILGLGHLARRFNDALSAEAIESVKRALKDEDDYVRGQANAAWDDITHFCI